MKKGILLIGIVIVLGASYYNYLQIKALKNMPEDREDPVQLARLPESESNEDIELGDVMTKLQRHSNKLWFSGEAENWELAGFYIHELEESFEELTHEEVIDEGVNITDLTKAMGLGPLEMVEQSVEQQDLEAFKTSYQNLVNNCNACHQSSNHPFVVIKTPETPIFDNQEYKTP